MSIPGNLTDREMGKFVEATTEPGLPAVAVVNPDGTPISAGGGGSGTEYTEGATDASITGTAALAEGASDTLRPLQVFELAGNYVLKTAITDASGNQITSFGGGTQYTEGDTDGTITGTAMMFEDDAGTDQLGVVSQLNPLPVLIMQEPVSIDDNGGSITVDGAVTVSGTVAATQSGAWNITNITGTVSLPTGAATAANQLPDGHNVTVDNAAGAAAVNIQDGGNSITVDGAVTVSGTVASTQSGAWSVAVNNAAGASAVNIQDGGNSITVDGAVTVSGTVAATQSGTWILGANSGVDIGDVTINNAAGASAVNIQDGGNSITVDGTVAATQSGTWILGANSGVDIGDVTINNAAGASAVNIQDGGNSITVDGTVAVSSITTSVTPGTAAANLGKAEDAAHASGDTGVMALGIRRDTPVAGANASADGDYIPIAADNLGKLWTAQTQTEDAAHASGDRGAFILAVRNDNGATIFTSANGDYSPIGVTANGAQYLSSVIPGTTATELGKAEDAAHTSGDTGVMALGVRNTANSTLSGTDGDYSPIAVDIMSGPISGVRRSSTVLTDINTTYDDSPTTATSATVDCSMFRRGVFIAAVTESGAATDITFTLQMSQDGTNWFDYRVGPWVRYRFDDATISSHSTLAICEPFECACSNVRMVVTATGTDASNTFTVANARFEFIN